MHHITKRLLLIRFLRSIGQGAMVVDLTLYLKDLHWSGVGIGGVTTAAGLVGAVLILLVGLLSDRMGRRPFLLIYEGLTIISAVLAAITSYAMILILGIVIAGFGRGQSGAAGPFGPAEQAWLARHVKQADRGFVFSLNNAAGFVGMAIGAVIGGLPGLFQHVLPIVAYRPVFIMVGVISFLCMLILIMTREEPKEATPFDLNLPVRGQTESSVGERESRIRKQENRSIFKLAIINTLNGLAVGLTGPMMAYWFSLRYGVSTSAIGMTLSVGFLMTGISSLINGFLAERIGMVRSVTWMRVIGSLMMFIMPWMPNFTLASVLFIIRGAINRGTQGSRTALSASLTRDQRRGFAASINALSMRLPSSIGPTVSGYLFDAGDLALPLILTAGLQLANAAIYQWAFGSYDGRRDPKSKNSESASL